MRDYSVYLAGPFFNPEQRATIKKLEDFLTEMGLRVYSPSRDGKKLDITTDSPELRKEVFEDNVLHLTNSDILVAVVDDRDPGTIWEMGCRYGAWASSYGDVPSSDSLNENPMIVTYTDHDYGVNLMILESIMCHCRGTDELGAYLKKVIEGGIENAEIDRTTSGRTEVI